MAKKTALYDIHKLLGAKIVDFAGYEMPVQYEGIIAEHMAVRNSCGVFDVSHMGEFFISGAESLPFIQKVTTNDASKLSIGKIQYSAACYKDGGIVDDLLVYRLADSEYMMVVNASNIEKDYNWLQENRFGDCELIDRSDDFSLLAVQGQNSGNIMKKLTDLDLDSMKYYTWLRGEIAGLDAFISRTGYTGEKIGYEVMVSSDKDSSVRLWNAIFEAGKEFNVKPIGLGARDTLRLEAGYCLYGNDIDKTTDTIEAGLGWITKPAKGEFNGKEKVMSELNNGISRKLVGFIVDSKLVARHGYDIYVNGDKAGYVTSGAPSPCLGKNIGLGYVKTEHSNIGDTIQIKIRNDFVNAEIVKIPFVNKEQ